MIKFVVPSVQIHTVVSVQDRIPKDQAARIEVVTLADLARARDLPASTYVFGGLERTTDEGRALARQVWDQLVTYNGMRLLNNPNHFVSRYDLLERLFAAGLNEHRAHKVENLGDAEVRYPVFIRRDSAHAANLTELLYTREETERAVRALERSYWSLNDLIAVEYRHTADKDGVYRKYSVCKVGSALISHALDHSGYWVVKRYPRNLIVSSDDPITKRIVSEEYAFVRDDPHEATLREVFKIAKVDYGRVDYGLADEKPCIWEINTSPSYGRPPEVKRTPKQRILGDMRRPAKTLFNDRFVDALLSIETEEDGPRCPIDIEDDLRQNVLAAEEAGLTALRQLQRIRALAKISPKWRFLAPIRRTFADALLKNFRS